MSSQAALQTSSSSSSPPLRCCRSLPLPPRAAPCPVSYCVVTKATRPETVPAAHARLQSSFIIISSSPARDRNIREGPRRARAPPAGQSASRPARADKPDDRSAAARRFNTADVVLSGSSVSSGSNYYQPQYFKYMTIKMNTFN